MQCNAMQCNAMQCNAMKIIKEENESDLIDRSNSKKTEEGEGEGNT